MMRLLPLTLLLLLAAAPAWGQASTFAERIEALANEGRLIVGWQPNTPADLDAVRRYRYKGDSLTHAQAVQDIPLLETAYAARFGWSTGAGANTHGDEGGVAVWEFEKWAPEGIDPRVGLNQTVTIQWAERVNENFIHLASGVDPCFGGGIKSLFFDYERNARGELLTNGPGEFIVTTSHPLHPKIRTPRWAAVTTYYTDRHLGLPGLLGISGYLREPGKAGVPWLRPDKWAVYTVTIDFGPKWTLKGPRSLTDYRLTDPRWELSPQQEAALAAGDLAALKAAPQSKVKHHRIRNWVQYEDWAEPLLFRDTTFPLWNAYNWTGPGTEANYGVILLGVHAYKLGETPAGGRGVPVIPCQLYDWSGTPGPAWRWYGGGVIVARGEVSPKVFGQTVKRPAPIGVAAAD
jgi:hypothetical protein